jgi:hypothetical protein
MLEAPWVKAVHLLSRLKKLNEEVLITLVTSLIQLRELLAWVC